MDLQAVPGLAVVVSLLVVVVEPLVAGLAVVIDSNYPYSSLKILCFNCTIYYDNCVRSYRIKALVERAFYYEQTLKRRL